MTKSFSFNRSDFPDDFLFGVATSAYQIEGSDFGNCGPSHWDTFAATPGNTARAENGALACDHFHRFEEDLDLIAGANLDHYRFSVSWARIMPEGFGKPNVEGLDFYDRLTDAILQRDIKPMLTLHHWDMPAALSDLGGWRNRDIASWFADFAETVTRRIGDRMWATGTFNEPWCITWLSHFLGHHAPGLRDIRATARAMHHVLVAHAKTMDVLRANGLANLGIYLNFEPAIAASDKPQDKAATARHNATYNDWFLSALTKGTYPEAALEGLGPHMPEGWEADMHAISQPLDWLGINNYTRKIIADDGIGTWPCIAEVEGPLPKTEMGWEIAPDNFGDLIRWVATTYTGDLPLYISENGMAGPEVKRDGVVNDPERIDYLDSHIAAMRDAMADGAPVKGYTVWSLLDNYEWALGYDKRFGLIHVDYETLERTPKESWHALKAALAR